MKYAKILRTLAVAVILSLVIVLILATPVLAAPVITLFPTSGSPGTRVTVAGTNFESYRGDSISVFFNGKEIGSLVVPEDGIFTTDFDVPDDTVPGRVYVTVKDEGGNQLGNRRTFIVQEIEIELYPGDGAVGTMVTINGKGFYASGTVSVYYYENGTRVNLGTGAATPTGEFTYTFSVPSSTAGKHKITARDVLDNSDKADFKVIPSIILGPSSGAIGSKVTVSGTGFGYKSYVSIYFDKAEVAIDRTDKYGSFEVTFDVPVMQPGTYDIEAEDRDDNTDKTGFTISAGVNLSQYTGNVGTTLTVSGMGFIVGGTVTINYDDVQVATEKIGEYGSFEVTFDVPASIGGIHTITASDGTNIVKRMFTMESEAPPTPTLLLPEDDSETEAEAYFDWEDVDDPSGVTYTFQIATDADFNYIALEKDDLTSSDYLITKEERLLPTKKEAPYYWRVKAIDGASNGSEWSTSGSFYISSSFVMPSGAKYALIAIGVGFLCFWLGRRTAYSRE